MIVKIVGCSDPQIFSLHLPYFDIPISNKHKTIHRAGNLSKAQCSLVRQGLKKKNQEAMVERTRQPT